LTEACERLEHKELQFAQTQARWQSEHEHAVAALAASKRELERTAESLRRREEQCASARMEPDGLRPLVQSMQETIEAHEAEPRSRQAPSADDEADWDRTVAALLDLHREQTTWYRFKAMVGSWLRRSH
jgi:hypothetical protein